MFNCYDVDQTPVARWLSDVLTYSVCDLQCSGIWTAKADVNYTMTDFGVATHNDHLCVAGPRIHKPVVDRGIQFWRGLFAEKILQLLKVGMTKIKRLTA